MPAPFAAPESPAVPGPAPIRQAVVLVGGKGTRLGALTRETPKPLLPIDGERPFLDFLLTRLAEQGFDDLVLVAGHLGEQVEARYGAGALPGLGPDRPGAGARLRVIREPEPRGTAGALLEAARALGPDLHDPFLALNGDGWLEANLRGFAADSARAPEPAVIATLPVPDARRYGTVEVRDARITAFREKDPASGAGLINAGVYRLTRAALQGVSALPASIETDLFPSLAARGALGARPVSGFFVDIGLPESLALARAEMPARERRPIAFLDRDGVLNLDTHYPHRVEDLVLVDGAPRAVRRLNEAGFRTVVVTNQAGVAHGLYGEHDVHRFHAALSDALAAEGAFVELFLHCPFHPEGRVEAYRRHHEDRKPGCGMLRRAFAALPHAREGSFLIGDRDTDMAAAAAAGVPGHLFRGGNLDSFVRGLLERRASAA